MLEVFTWLADWLIYGLAGLNPESKLGTSLHFFVEDTTKIFALLVVMIYIIALARASLDLERIRHYIQQKNRFVGYGLGAGFGAITPFCSCSSIPLFLGFTSAGIPLGITMAFLFTSPIINEVAIIMLWGLLGWEFTLVYVVIGMAVGIGGGMILDILKGECWLKDFAAKAYQQAAENPHNDESPPDAKTLTMKDRHVFARDELKEIVGRIWKEVYRLLSGYGANHAINFE
ncbi:permease [Halomonas sp. CUBES01]|uniref:permease n=1 Tax=Halomonas sp. CUBES01 TaxID=2897340 RepID=UPI002DDD22AA|nr:permease [Halomonas sp. CUBES01]MEC4768741.1 permease [Halomonas sp. CUBES01]